MVTLPKPQTSGAKSAGRFVKPDFVYLVKDDVYRCPAGEKLTHHFIADEDGQKMRIYLTKACRTCPLKNRCTTANERRIKRWEHEHVVEAAQTRLDKNPRPCVYAAKPSSCPVIELACIEFRHPVIIANHTTNVKILMN